MNSFSTLAATNHTGSFVAQIKSVFFYHFCQHFFSKPSTCEPNISSECTCTHEKETCGVITAICWVLWEEVFSTPVKLIK